MTRLPTDHWYVTRLVFLVASIFIVGSVILGFMWHEYWFYFAGFVGIMEGIFALTGYCPMAFILSWLGVPCRCVTCEK